MPQDATDSRPIRSTFAAGAALLAAAAANAQAPDLAAYFGFDDPRIIVVDDDCGPAVAADFDGDGRTDLAIVNNRKSRIEIHRQRASQRAEAEIAREYKVNETPPSPWFDRTDVSVSHRVTAFRAHDVTGDGRLDIVYAGRPSEIVIMAQGDGLDFEESSKRRVPGLAAGQDGFAVADVLGDPRPELLAVVGGKIHVYDLTGKGVTGEPVELGTGDEIRAFLIEDYNGDGRDDVLAAIPEDDAPLRLWLQRVDPAVNFKTSVLGPEIRFDMPPIIEAEPVRLPGRAAASISLIERTTRRIVLFDVVTETIEDGQTGASPAERDAIYDVRALRGGSADRAYAVGDLDGDGLEDLLATDPAGNSIVLHRQGRGRGLGPGEFFSAFKQPKTVLIGDWDADGAPDIFVLSEEEKAVGVSAYDPSARRITFPTPMPVTAGRTPVAIGLLESSGGAAALAVVTKDRRDHELEIHRPEGEPARIPLEDVNRPPQSMISGDFDRDGVADLLLFTPGEPMVMVAAVGGDSPVVLTDETMPQFGLVQAAGPDNTAKVDIDGDGRPELLIADANFVRACTYEGERGWRVVEQITMPEADASLVGLSTIDGDDGPMIVASDRENERLVMIDRRDDAWRVADRLRVAGFDLGAIQGGSFTGDDAPNVLCMGGAAVAVVRLSGEHTTLEEVAVFRSDLEDRLEHEIEVGDVNGDGYADLVVLDAAEQMCQIFTLSASRKLRFATEFKVFETRLFGRGDAREFEPSYATLADFTGDGLTDIALEVHDRYIIYPQSTGP